MAVSGLEIREKAETMGICIPAGVESQFEIHGSMVMEWNQRLNLTRIPEEEMAEKHFVDSLTLLLVPEVRKAKTGNTESNTMLLWLGLLLRWWCFRNICYL